MRHTRYGYWLEEAGPVEPTRPLEGDTTADVVIVGGGYLGLWTAWQLKALEPALDVVVLDAGLAGHGPSGRNGGFVSTLWDDLPILRDRSATRRRSRSAAPRSGPSTGSAPCARSMASTRGTAPAARSRSRRARRSSATGTSSSRHARRSAHPKKHSHSRARRSRQRCASPAFLGGMALRTAANVQPARLALGLRARVIAGRCPAARAHAGPQSSARTAARARPTARSARALRCWR